MGRCPYILEPDAQLLAQSNNDRCTRSTMPTISTLGRVRRRAEQVHAQFRGESYPAPHPHHLVRLSISKEKSASCNNCICRIEPSNDQTRTTIPPAVYAASSSTLPVSVPAPTS